MDGEPRDLAGPLCDQAIPSAQTASLRLPYKSKTPATAVTARGHDPRSCNSHEYPKRTRACAVVVDRETADILRAQARKIYVFNHELFEDFEEFGPDAQEALAMRFCATTALMNAVGWKPKADERDTVEIP